VDTCNDHACPNNCHWAPWGVWTMCSRSCKDRTGMTGFRSRLRAKNWPEPRGQDCLSGSPYDFDFCNTQPCPIDGQWGGWSNWGACSKSCGPNGVQSRERRCDNPEPQYAGCKQCAGGDAAGKQTQPCNTGVHCPVDGFYSKWTEFSECSHKCGGGQKTRTRVCTPPKYFGTPCSAIGAAVDTVSCNNHLCDSKGVTCGCQGDTAKLSCKEGGGLIHISQEHDVYYGREEVAVCGQKVVDGWDYHCRAMDGKAKVIAECEGKEECSIPVTNDYFGNPCKGTYKYLRVHYQCTGGQYETLRHFCSKCKYAYEAVRDATEKVIDISPSLP